ncbi:GTP cyclohydrolase I FolE [Flagellimonas sp. CMM7]|uniref:GTP cyclohydrolase I FolE n=1 Tax=Flagellimonas sp. CMM7 TaxID=2654676 RepID=UPI0013D4B9FB|nr:GTP cyclohydrolase I FolE [Flagellimonas sp. CMM7]UII81296.1 GTP cyclohydrolase I FolE [Flagellimonas sp. CMM7]
MNKSQIEVLGDNHIATSVKTPMREDAFEHTDEKKIKNIQYHFSKIMEELGLDVTDESLSGTPYRFAKMYIKELSYGLNPKNKPKISTFPNTYGYQRMLVEQDITIHSSCEHHFLPIVGYAHVGYVPKNNVVGLSKINRLVDYYAHRPQVQERLCLQILEDLQQTLETDDVIVMIHAKHLCVSSRGIKDRESSTTTLEYGGVFANENIRSEFFNLLKNTTDLSK